MWEALSRYQPYADADGHGETWRKMCEERTEEVAWAAAVALVVAVLAAAWAAARAAEAAEAADVKYWSDCAIERIERAIKERNND
jgi:hypothetical protein